MMVMVSNLSGGGFHYLAGRFPGQLGHLYSPGGWRNPIHWFPYALDNGAFKGFDEVAFFAHLDKAKAAAIQPMWVAVPDVLGDRPGTLARWDEYLDRVAAYGWDLAFVVQDGMTVADVPKRANLIFIGGSMEWKLKTLSMWGAEYPRVHAGRINTERLLWLCYDAGVESVDGTGWWHHKQYQQLETYLKTVAQLEANAKTGSGRATHLHDGQSMLFDRFATCPTSEGGHP
jgi:hypothetical protein